MTCFWTSLVISVSSLTSPFFSGSTMVIQTNILLVYGFQKSAAFIKTTLMAYDKEYAHVILLTLHIKHYRSLLLNRISSGYVLKELAVTLADVTKTSLTWEFHLLLLCLCNVFFFVVFFFFFTLEILRCHPHTLHFFLPSLFLFSFRFLLPSPTNALTPTL